jgi:iron complex transport system permease protein
MNASRVHEAYRKTVLARTALIIFLVCCGAIAALAGLGIGPVKYGVSEIAGALANSLFGLAVAGMQMQVILRNPLASPFTLGVASGAALGAGVAIITGFTLFGGRYMLIANAFAFSLLPCAVVYVLSRVRPSGYAMLILAGIAMNFIFDSVLTLLSYFSTSEELKALSLWTMGNLGRATWKDIAPLAAVLAVTVPLLFMQNQKLNVLNAGDESARALGVNVERTRITILTLTSLVSAAIICFTGIIGFVGLVSPHIVRMVMGNDARYLMPASGLFGAVFLLAADVTALKILEPAVLPVGIITSFVGGPMLLYFIARRPRHSAW